MTLRVLPVLWPLIVVPASLAPYLQASKYGQSLMTDGSALAVARAVARVVARAVVRAVVRAVARISTVAIAYSGPQYHTFGEGFATASDESGPQYHRVFCSLTAEVRLRSVDGSIARVVIGVRGSSEATSVVRRRAPSDRSMGVLDGGRGREAPGFDEKT